MKNATIIFNGYATKKAGTSGGEEHGLNLVKGLISSDHQTTLLSPQGYPDRNQIKSNRYLLYPNLPKEENFYDLLPVLFLIYFYRIIASAILLQKAPRGWVIASSHLFHDIIPTYFAPDDQLYMTYIHHIISEQKRAGFHFVVTSFLEKISFSIIKRKNFLVFVDSERIKDALAGKYAFNPANIYVTRNGVSLEKIEKIQGQKKVYEISFCGRLSRAKGIFDLIAIVNELKKDFPQIKCAVIGAGKEEESVREEVKKKNLTKNFDFLGFVSEEKKIKTIKESEIFLFPSHEEGWGIVIGESLSCGVPVVVYDLPDITTIWKDNVIWVKSFKTKEFAKKAKELLNNKEKRAEMSKKGLNFAKSLSWGNIIRNEIKIMEERSSSSLN